MTKPAGQWLQRLLLGAAGDPDQQQWTLHGLSMAPDADGGLTVSARRAEATQLRLTFGAWVAEVEKLTLERLRARWQPGGAPRLDVGHVALQGLKLSVSAALPPEARSVAETAPADRTPPACGKIEMAPLASLSGSLRATITDAALLFDADVTVPIRQGAIDFNAATVEHIGPDSRMGVSRLGLYVDAPNGRSYLYQMGSVPLAGLTLEQRGGLLGVGISDRGSLTLQPFIESLLRQTDGHWSQGWTDQALLLLKRTALRGELSLGDGRLGIDGLEATLQGQAAGRNTLTLTSQSVGNGVIAEMPTLDAVSIALRACGFAVLAGRASADLTARLSLEGEHGRLSLLVERAEADALCVGPQTLQSNSQDPAGDGAPPST